MGAAQKAYKGVEFDHVVVGARSAGCAVTRRLVDAGRRVLLIETGGQDDDPAIHDPGSLGKLWNSPSDYAYFTEPQTHADNTKVFWPRGRVLGGSSAINAMIYVRGHRADYDNWAAAGATGWTYNDVLPYFKRSEDFEDGPSHYHGTGGPLGVSRNHRPNPVSSAFVEACVDSGLPLNNDCNAEDTLGAGLLHRTIRDGKRNTAWVAFLAPILDNPLLTVRTNCRANRIIFDDQGTAHGIEVETHGELSTVRCSGDVILSGGTIGTTQLLLLSGIGPADDLRALGIPVRANLPGVGQNLHDHTIAPMVWQSPSLIPDGQENKLEAQYFAHSDTGQPVPDLQPLMSHMPLPVAGYQVPAAGHGWTVLAGHVRPLSRGSIRLRTANPADTPVLDPNYLADPADLTALITAIRMTREIVAEKALTDWRSVEIAPGPGIHTDAEIAAYIRHTLQSYHHQVGTCRIGTDPDAVVDPTLRVHGIPGLRIADASVMPSVPSGNTNAPAIMIGERCADLTLGQQT